MKWLAPVVIPEADRPAPPKIRKKDGAVIPEGRPARPVVVDGVRYRSMSEACKALGWTYTRLYYAIGEGWRCGGKAPR